MITANKKLSIAIPTYNRSEILRENLNRMLPELIACGVAVYISDDSTDGLTELMVRDLSVSCPLINYQRNVPSLGHDRNFFATLALPNTQYVWYLGDSLYFLPGALKKVIELISVFDHDFVFVNSYARDLNSFAVADDMAHDFLVDKTWYLTLSGATVYGERPLELASTVEPKSEWKNFPQLALILHACSNYSMCFYWLGKPSLGFNRKKTSYWLHSAFSVFVNDWTALIRSFSSYFSLPEQNSIIRSHGENTGLFGVFSLIRLRAAGGLSQSVLERHWDQFLVVSPIHWRWARFLTKVPRWLVGVVWWPLLGLRRLVFRVFGV